MADYTDNIGFAQRLTNFDVQLDTFGILHAVYDVHPGSWAVISAVSYFEDIPVGTLTLGSRRWEADGYFYRCTQAGRVGATEPDWNTWPAEGMTDGTVKWERIAATEDMRSIYYRRTGAEDWTFSSTDRAWPAHRVLSQRGFDSYWLAYWQERVFVANGIRPQITALPPNDLEIRYETAAGVIETLTSQDGGRSWA